MDLNTSYSIVNTKQIHLSPYLRWFLTAKVSVTAQSYYKCWTETSILLNKVWEEKCTYVIVVV